MDDTALDAALQGKETPEAEAETAETTEDGRPKFVPHAALHEERLKRQASEKEAADLRNWQRQMMERFQAAEARKAEEEAPKPPSLDDDPIGAIVHKLDTVEGRLQEDQRQRQLQAEAQAWNQYVERDRQQFMAQAPDYTDALNHLAENRATMYRAMGYQDHEVNALLNQDANAFAARARQTGMSLSAMLYQAATAVGYQRPAGQQPADKLATIQRGQETTRNAGAGKAKASLTPADLLAMSDNDFLANFEKVMKE
jgi:hypothetical protein